ncbi:RagB/SusD family nutrient uptake outer membrane protein [Solitalea canadensis]|uniref:RagB/SusD family protein n=1 Tax=Solitalea canadensis (strain ATCC 29591 / DSM 3403 / JCM 21819 / LMG 8368 / NBRC 15130 / NCIMB 12057 / USAM 9D) TaxID=929556 RepID=H8KXC0_SOLCM|nr:RagB/SusD family nutrient uptake outer membrane protein [Solitalea canadensis]AFD08449.1 RagB/SusD family protein [Solitalea canadensis DSM 3403]
MKRNTYILTLLTATLSLTSCEKEFLDKEPLSTISNASFWSTEKDVYLALNGCYAYLDGGDGVIYGDGATDNAHAQYPWESISGLIASGDVSPSSESPKDYAFVAFNQGWDFISVGRCNYLLENIDKVSFKDNALKERYKAEARFLRAFRYFNMISTYGDVPLILKTLTTDEAKQVTREKEATVLAFVLKELEETSSLLPASYSGGFANEKGRITKGAALALKARVHLYYGQWDKAAEAAQQVMGMGYQLFKVNSESDADKLDNYDNWVDFTNDADRQKFRLGIRSYEQLFYAVNEGNSEVILDRQYMAGEAWGSTVNGLYTLLGTDAQSGWSSVAPTQELVNAYLMKDGRVPTAISPATRATRYKARQTDPAFYNEYKNRDPRFYATIQFEGNPWAAIQSGYVFEWVKGGNNCSQTGYNFRKLVDPTETVRDWSGNNNVILIRYAEILLTYAEAKNELSGPDAIIYDALDKIRERVDMPLIDRTTYNTKESLRSLIRNERRVELALEGHRYFDIRRWGIGENVMKTIVNLENETVEPRAWYDKLMKLPVPQSQIDLAPGLKPNNTGY